MHHLEGAGKDRDGKTRGVLLLHHVFIVGQSNRCKSYSHRHAVREENKLFEEFLKILKSQLPIHHTIQIDDSADF